MRYWFLDIQTTGTSPTRDYITEVAWSGPLTEDELLTMQHGGGALPAVGSSYVRLPENFEWQRGRLRKWKALTGQDPGVLADAPGALDVWKRILSSLLGPHEDWSVVDKEMGRGLCCVIHFAQFEKQFLGQLLGGSVFPFEVLCTYRLASELLPALPSKSLRSVAGRLGHFTGEFKRASQHLEATLVVASGLFLLARGPEPASMGASTPAALIEAADRLALPHAAGVYRFIGPGQATLYIGKAKNLKSRVNSYFRGKKSKGARLHEMLSQARSVGVMKTSHAVTAALIESLLIKDFEPPYNRALRARNRRLTWGVMESGPFILSEDSAGFFAILRSIWFLDAALPERSPGAFRFEQEPFEQAVEQLRAEFGALLGPPSAAGLDIGLLLRFSRYLVSQRRLEKLRAERETANEAVPTVEEVEEEDPQALPKVPESADAGESKAEAINAILKSTMRQFLRSAIRARAIHRIANSWVRFRDAAGNIQLVLFVRGGRVDADSFKMVTEDVVFASWAERYRRAAELSPGSKKVLGLAEWDFCSVLLSEVQRFRTAGGEVEIVAQR